MALLNIIFITFGFPKYFIFFFINFNFIVKKKIFNFKNFYQFFLKNFTFLYVIFIFLIFFNNLLNYNFLVQNQYYIVLLSVIFYLNLNGEYSNTGKIFWYLSLLYFVNILLLIIFNNLFLDCLISNNGFFDFFSKINGNYAVLNIDRFNCNDFYQQGLLEHQSNFKFKIFIFLLVNSLSLILNSDKEKILIYNLMFHVYLNFLVFSLSSRGLGLVFLINSFLVIFFLNQKRKKIQSIILITSLIASSSLFFLKPIEMVNIFFFKDLSYNQNHVTRENLFQKIRLINYNPSKVFDSSKEKSSYLEFSYRGRGVRILDSERWSEYKSFVEKFYKKYFLNEKNITFQKYYHNYYFNEIAKFGLPSFFLIFFIFILNLKNITSLYNFKNNKTFFSSIIFLAHFTYLTFFDAFLSGNLRNLILLIIFLFILNNYNERSFKKI